MAFVCIGQLIYVADSVWFEKAILTTMDITTDGLGYMLVVGDLVWVPFTYTMQARYLANNNAQLDGFYLTALVAMFALSYATFRGSNSQKNTFRTLPIDHPSVYHKQANETEHGPGIHPDRVRLPTPHFRLVGPRPPYKLPWRLGHGIELVLGVWEGERGAVLLRGVFRGAAGASGGAG